MTVISQAAEGDIVYAAIALLIYDYSLTLSDEVQLIWKSPWHLGKILFLLTRYLAFVDLPLFAFTYSSAPQSQCKALVPTLLMIILAGITIAEVIMLLRVWALWGRSLRVTIFLGMTVGITMVINLISTALHIYGLSYAPSSSPIRGCTSTRGNHLLLVSLSSLIAVETLTLVMTLIKCVEQVRLHGSSLFKVCLRDGTIYFVCQLASTLANVVLLSRNPLPLGDMITLQRSLHSILSGRIILKLRRTASDNDKHTNGWLNRSALEFAHTIPIDSHSNDEEDECFYRLP